LIYIAVLDHANIIKEIKALTKITKI